jgi:hypothetical protein
MISTKPLSLNADLSIRDNLDLDSNRTEESDLHPEKHLSRAGLIKIVIVISASVEILCEYCVLRYGRLTSLIFESGSKSSQIESCAGYREHDPNLTNISRLIGPMPRSRRPQ